MNNLPPGVTDRDTDPPTMTCPQCGGKGIRIVNINGENMMEFCARCGGDGEVNKTANGE